jgi:hypothetical protein
MGSAAVIFVLLVVIVGMAIGWNADRVKNKPVKEQLEWYKAQTEYWAEQGKRIPILEAEIQRLRKIPLTHPLEKADNSTIKAKSSADVRRLTEAAFGLKPEIGVSNEDE